MSDHTHYARLEHKADCPAPTMPATEPMMQLCSTHKLIYCKCNAEGHCPRCFETNPGDNNGNCPTRS